MILPILWRENNDGQVSFIISSDGLRVTVRVEKPERGTYHEEHFNVDGRGHGRAAARFRNLADWMDSQPGVKRWER